MSVPALVRIPVRCDKCRAKVEIDCVHTPGFGLMHHDAVDCPACGGRIHPLLPGDIVDVRQLVPPSTSISIYFHESGMVNGYGRLSPVPPEPSGTMH